MESIDGKELVTGRGPQWEMIDFIEKKGYISPRSNLIMSHISGDTVLIAGGHDGSEKYRRDCFMVDLRQ